MKDSSRAEETVHPVCQWVETTHGVSLSSEVASTLSWGSVGVQITTARGKKAESPRQMPLGHSCLVPLTVRAAPSGLTTETTGQCNLKDRSPKKIREVSWRQMEWDVRVDVTGNGAPSKVRA